MPDPIAAPVWPHIAGNDALLTPQQRELIALAATLGRDRFAPRAARYDREASFPFENFADLRDAGLLGICVPKAHGGLGADFATYVMVAAEIGRHCGSTALSFNMHVCSTMWSGFIADALDMSAAAARRPRAHVAPSTSQRVVGDGKVYSQPFSEGGAAAAGKAPWGTLRAIKVDGRLPRQRQEDLCFVVRRRRLLRRAVHAGRPGVHTAAATLRDSLYLAVPADAPGVTVTRRLGPAGHARHVSRTLLLDDVWVPARGAG